MGFDKCCIALIAPDQNRTDTRSLEGYCSTIELQAQERKRLCKNGFFFSSPIFKNLFSRGFKLLSSTSKATSKIAVH